MFKHLLLPSLLLTTDLTNASGKDLTPALSQRCAPCHGPDLNGVGGVFPSLMTSALVKSGNLEGVIQFITHGSPADSNSLVKMPAKGGHLDLGDEEIHDIAKQVIELAKAYVEKKPADEVSSEGYFKNRFVQWCRPRLRPLRFWPGLQQKVQAIA